MLLLGGGIRLKSTYLPKDSDIGTSLANTVRVNGSNLSSIDVKSSGLSVVKKGPDLSSMTWPEISNLADDIKKNPDDYDDLLGQTKSIAISGYGTFDFMCVSINHPFPNNGTRYGTVWMPETQIITKAALSAQSANLTYSSITYRSTLETTVFNSFPAEIRNVMKNVTINYTSSAGGPNWTASATSTLSAKIFLPSAYEIGGNSSVSGWSNVQKSPYNTEGTQFTYFTTHNAAKDFKRYSGSDATWYWVRSISYWYASTTYFGTVGSNSILSGSAHSSNAGPGIVPCFVV